MLEHRFRHLLNPASTTFGSPMGCAFAFCPIMSHLAPAHQACIQEIYRIAAELTREQLRPRPSRIPQFSLN